MTDYRYGNNNEGHVSVSEWIITALVMAIPLVNLVMPFVWAFGTGTKKSKANFFKAQIILALVGVLLWFVLGSAMLGSFRRIPVGVQL